MGYSRDWRVGIPVPVGGGPVWLRRGLRGLGQTFSCDDDGSNCVETDTPIATVPSPTPTTLNPVSLTPVTVPVTQQWVQCPDGSITYAGNPCPGSSIPTLSTSTSSSFTNELNQLLNSWTQIGSRVIAPTTTVTTAGGTTITTPASSTAASSLLSSAGIGGMSIGTMLLLAGLAMAVLWVAKK